MLCVVFGPYRRYCDEHFPCLVWCPGAPKRFPDGAGFKGWGGAGLAGPFGCGRPCDHHRQAPAVHRVEVPQFQFIDRVVDFSVVLQRRVPTVLLCRRPVRSHSCSFWTRFMTLVVVQRQVLGLTVQKTVDVPQLQCSDKVVDVPVVQVVAWASSSWTRLLTCPLLCMSCSSC